MLRYDVKLAMAFFALFAVATLLVRAQPYDETELRALLMPDGCTMPCFMGIRPWTTSVDEAVKLLQGSPWVKGVEVERRSAEQVDSVEWIWSGKQPAFINGSVNGSLHVLSRNDLKHDIGTVGQTVMSLRFQSSIPYGSLYLLLGSGVYHEHYQLPNPHVGTQILTYYPELDLVVSSHNIPCPVTPTKYWQAPLLLEIGRGYLDYLAILYVCGV